MMISKVIRSLFLLAVLTATFGPGRASGQATPAIDERELIALLQAGTDEASIRKHLAERGCSIHFDSRVVKALRGAGVSANLLRPLLIREKTALETRRALAKQFADGWDDEVADLRRRKLAELSLGPATYAAEWRAKEAILARQLREVDEAERNLN